MSQEFDRKEYWSHFDHNSVRILTPSPVLAHEWDDLPDDLFMETVDEYLIDPLEDIYPCNIEHKEGSEEIIHLSKRAKTHQQYIDDNKKILLTMYGYKKNVSNSMKSEERVRIEQNISNIFEQLNNKLDK